MSLNLITDRTAADLAAAREIIAKVQRGETLTEAEQSQFDAGLRGCYNASDLNRVEAAVKSIAAALNAAGYSVEVVGSHDWQTTDIIRLSQWRQYLANVQALRDAYTALSTTPELPQPTDKLGIEGANNIERVLADIDTLISCMIASYRRCGAFNAGDNAAHLPLKGSAT